jgi:hypothetical protein
MPLRCPLLLFAASLGLGGAALPALACAVTTHIRIENRSTQPVRETYVSAPDQGRNQLPRPGLAPGQSASIMLPSCIGVYDVTTVFADGRRMEHRGLDARTISELILR